MRLPSGEAGEYSEEREREIKRLHDAWLQTALGTPPHQYPWGSVASVFDPKALASAIIVTYA
jgi:hypothetical protein